MLLRAADILFRWLYTLFLMIDGNFRVKCKDRGLNDIELGNGQSYFVEDSPYKAHIAKCGDQVEVSALRNKQHCRC